MASWGIVRLMAAQLGVQVRYAGYGLLTCATWGTTYYSQCQSVTTSTIVKCCWHWICSVKWRYTKYLGFSFTVSEWVSSFLTAHQHIKGYFVLYNADSRPIINTGCRDWSTSRCNSCIQSLGHVDQWLYRCRHTSWNNKFKSAGCGRWIRQCTLHSRQ